MTIGIRFERNSTGGATLRFYHRIIAAAALGKEAELSRSRVRTVLLLELAVLLAAGLVMTPRSPQVSVSYEVTGAGRVEVRYAAADGALAAPAVVALPWRKQFTVTRDVRFLTMSAARRVSAPGDISCRITVDGTVVALDGLGGGSAQCTGTVPAEA
ncbi:MmpS family transport accessory protein [Mycobacterium sp. WMMD1722]|uniref:MmpS family transport accessory protein n=1 Tax=Mycobacterium sp. WMMD1722 TaxID=3404117 RepID=UPI003BF53643